MVPLWMIVPGAVSLVSGAVLLAAPRRLLMVEKRLSGPGTMLETDLILLKHRVSGSICFLVIGVFCLASAYYVWLRLNL